MELEALAIEAMELWLHELGGRKRGECWVWVQRDGENERKRDDIDERKERETVESEEREKKIRIF